MVSSCRQIQTALSPPPSSISCRCVRQSSAIFPLDDVAVDADALLHNNPGLRGPFMCLDEARLGISFGALGAARDSLEEALTYTTERHQFDQPIASYQLTQEKLANMALELNKGQLLALSPLIFVPVYDAHPLGAFVICCAALSLIILMQVKVKP